MRDKETENLLADLSDPKVMLTNTQRLKMKEIQRERVGENENLLGNSMIPKKFLTKPQSKRESQRV